MIWVLKNTLKYSCACFQDGAEFNFQNDSSPRQTVAFVFVFYVKDLSILNPKGKQAHSLGRKEDIRWWRGLKLRICWAVTPDTWQGSYQTGTNTTSPREEKDQDQSGCWDSWDGAAPLWKPERKGCKYPVPQAYMIIVYMIIPWTVKGGKYIAEPWGSKSGNPFIHWLPWIKYEAGIFCAPSVLLSD